MIALGLIPRRTPCTVPPELRRLRDAWAWARRTSPAADRIGARCPAMIETQMAPGIHTLTATTISGDGVSVIIRDSELVILHVAEPLERITLPLPTHLTATLPRPHA